MASVKSSTQLESNPSMQQYRVTKMYPSLAIAPLIFFAHLCSASPSGSYCSMATDCNANEYCDYSAYACTPKKSNGGTCTSSEQCVGLCDYTLSKCIAKKTYDALCSSSSQCVSGYCKSFPTSSGCSPGSCYSIPIKVLVTLKLGVIMTQ